MRNYITAWYPNFAGKLKVNISVKAQKKNKAMPAKGRTRSVKQKLAIRRRLKSSERRQQLIEAARRVFIRQGFHGTRTSDLALEAGVNVATFFMHFKSKQEIFDAAITDQLRTLVREVFHEGRAFASASDPHLKDQIGVQAIREIYNAVAEMSPLLVATLFHDREQGKKAYRTDVFPMVKRLRTAAKLSFNLKNDEDGEFVALAALGLCFVLHVHHEMLGSKANVGAVTARITNLLLHGAFHISPRR